MQPKLSNQNRSIIEKKPCSFYVSMLTRKNVKKPDHSCQTSTQKRKRIYLLSEPCFQGIVSFILFYKYSLQMLHRNSRILSSSLETATSQLIHIYCRTCVRVFQVKYYVNHYFYGFNEFFMSCLYTSLLGLISPNDTPTVIICFQQKSRRMGFYAILSIKTLIGKKLITGCLYYELFCSIRHDEHVLYIFP